jgi:myo-inositol-1(or 4)-monophosphatase
MALARKNELLLGVIYNPVYNELFTATRGEGAFLNGKRIRCSKISVLKNSLLCTGFPNHDRQAHPNIHYYWDFTLRSHGVRRDGSAALDLASVASGRFDSFWEFGLKAWDTAAGVIMVEESGGKITDLKGQPYQLGGASILASNGLIHDEMVRVAAEVAKRNAA